MKRFFQFAVSSFKQLPLLFTRQGRLLFRLKVLARIPGLAQQGRTAPGNLTHLEGMCLRELIKKTPPKSTVVEVGSFRGKSTLYLAEMAAKKKITIFCVDTWECDAMTMEKQDVYSEFLQNTAPYQSIIKPLRGPSDKIAKSFTTAVDVLWIDGDHSYEGCKKDIQSWLPFLKPGGLLCFHDYGNPCGVRQAVDELVRPRCQDISLVDSMFIGVYKPVLGSVPTQLS